jgi:hypothetical protein
MEATTFHFGSCLSVFAFACFFGYTEVAEGARLSRIYSEEDYFQEVVAPKTNWLIALSWIRL